MPFKFSEINQAATIEGEFMLKWGMRTRVTKTAFAQEI